MSQYLLNETFAVEASAAEEWVKFMDAECMDMISGSDLCKSHIFSQIAHGDNEGALSYALQIIFDSEEDMYHYNKQISPRIINKITTTFAGKFASFKTVMQIIGRSGS